MSFDVRNFRSATDDTVPSFLREAENGTTAAIRHNTQMEWGLIGKGARIINNDATNNLNVRLHSRTATILVIPPSSELIINEWFAVISCEPDAVTGDYQITIEVTTMEDAARLRLSA